jgi:hypothetical protein
MPGFGWRRIEFPRGGFRDHGWMFGYLYSVIIGGGAPVPPGGDDPWGLAVFTRGREVDQCKPSPANSGRIFKVHLPSSFGWLSLMLLKVVMTRRLSERSDRSSFQWPHYTGPE